MPRQIVSVAVLRMAGTPDGAGGYSQVESAIAGSPFAARVYRRDETQTGFVPGAVGDADADGGVIVSFAEPTVAVRIDDVVVLPDGRRARIVRVRRYARHAQCDTVVGVG